MRDKERGLWSLGNGKFHSHSEHLEVGPISISVQKFNILLYTEDKEDAEALKSDVKLEDTALKCILRKIQTEGLIKKYETEPEFALKMKFLSALAFVPTTDVVEAFEIVCDENMLPEDAQPILDYFEDTWIGRPQRRQHRRSPRFSHSMWNCFNTVVEGLPKTNNSIEGWHRAFEAQISADHPNIWKFVKAIQREQSLHELQIEQYVGGAAGPPCR
nr:unnamed protein product [Callosobruchus analis]